MNYINRWTFNKQNFTLDLAQHYRYFQPHIREDLNCSAMVMSEQGIMKPWKWVTIDCLKTYDNVTFVCEKESVGNTSSEIVQYVNMTIYETLVYTEKIRNALLVQEKSCSVGWLYHDGLCVSFYLHSGIFHGKPECEYISDEQMRESIQASSGTVASIMEKFLYSFIQSSVHLIQCAEPLVASEFSMKAITHKCSDGTFIIQHHLCDGEADCPDASDEANCSWVCHFSAGIEHHSCFNNCIQPNCTCSHLYFKCNSGGCVALSKFCNGFVDCEDASDEALCPKQNVTMTPPEEHELFTCLSGAQITTNRLNDTVPDCPVHGDDETLPSENNIMMIANYLTVALSLQCIPGHPKVYEYHQVCLMTWQVDSELATCRNGAHLSDCVYHSCPQHYKCEYSYCIPLHAVCNRLTDCPNGEDEQHCQLLSCPNTLKCKRDNVCIHHENMNDGIVDCPAYADDEVVVPIPACPTYCECMGHAMFCTEGDVFKSLSDRNSVTALIYRNVPEVKFTSQAFATFASLKYLDLSHSKLNTNISDLFKPLQTLIMLILHNVSLSEIQPYSFSSLQNIKDLQLQNNVIHTIHTDGFNGLSALTVLDLSKLNIQSILKCSFRGLQQLVQLDLSYNMIEQLGSGTFCGLKQLGLLYLQHNAIIYVDPLVFMFTPQLEVLASSVTGLCCYIDILHCSPKFDDQFASCTSILHHSAIKYSTYIIAATSIGLNSFAFCIVNLFFIDNNIKRKINNIFHKQLLLSDIAMGFFFLMLSLYNIVYTGDFVTVGHLWRQSIHCRILSYISMVSLEMTLFQVLIIGMDRFLAMCFPLKNFHVSVKTAWGMIISAWLVTNFISLAPLLNLYLNNMGLNNTMCVTILCFDLLSIWIVASIYVINTTATVMNLVLHLGVVRAVRNMQHNQAVLTRKV